MGRQGVEEGGILGRGEAVRPGKKQRCGDKKREKKSMEKEKEMMARITIIAIQNITTKHFQSARVLLGGYGGRRLFPLIVWRKQDPFRFTNKSFCCQVIQKLVIPSAYHILLSLQLSACINFLSSDILSA